MEGPTCLEQQKVKGTDSNQSFNKVRGAMLFIVFILVISAAGVLALRDPMVAAKLDALFHRDNIVSHSLDDLAAEERMDPPMGYALPSVGAGSAMRKNTPASRNGYLIVSIGACGSCTSFDYQQWQKDSKQKKIVLIGFTGESDKKIIQFQHEAKLKTVIFHDEGNLLLREINAYWGGRLYYFDSQWKLKWIMKGFASRKRMDELSDLLFEVEKNEK